MRILILNTDIVEYGVLWMNSRMMHELEKVDTIRASVDTLKRVKLPFYKGLYDVMLFVVHQCEPLHLRLIENIRNKMPECRIFILYSTPPCGDQISVLLRQNISAFFQQDTAIEELMKAMQLIRVHELRLVNREIFEALTDHLHSLAKTQHNENPYNALTQREREVLSLLAKSKRNEDIASVMGISELTVKTHLKSIYHKLNVVNRTQAASFALQHAAYQIYLSPSNLS